jgi:hypothetical protein
VLHDNYETLYFESYNNYEMLYFEPYNKYETSCMINYDCQSLEPVLLLHDICTIFTNFVLLPYNMCDKSVMTLILNEYRQSSNSSVLSFKFQDSKTTQNAYC